MSASSDYQAFHDHEKIYLENEIKKLQGQEHEKNYEKYEGSYQGALQYLRDAQDFGLFAPFQDAAEEIIGHIRAYELMRETYIDKLVERRIKRNKNLMSKRQATVPALVEYEQEVDALKGEQVNEKVTHKPDAQTWDVKSRNLENYQKDEELPKKLWYDRDNTRE